MLTNHASLYSQWKSFANCIICVKLLSGYVESQEKTRASFDTIGNGKRTNNEPTTKYCILLNQHTSFNSFFLKHTLHKTYSIQLFF